MQSDATTAKEGKRRASFWGALCATLALAAPGGTLAAPTETVLYSFMGGSDGASPQAGLIADGSGNLYGTTVGGGVLKCNPPFSCGGTVFKVAPSGTETVLHSFAGGNDGANPRAGLIADSSGNLYGTTRGGGGSGCLGLGCGVVFKLAPSGTETVLFSFCPSDFPCSNGASPLAGLIADGKGNLYGTTSSGGAPNAEVGTVFKLTPSGTETVLHSFPGGSDGNEPHAGLIADAKGNLYGTTFSGGGSGCGGVGCGVVFKVTPSGTERVIHSFCPSGFPCKDGINPVAVLTADAKGNLYGTTGFGGGGKACGTEFQLGCGTVFKLTPSGTETVLYSFCSKPGCSDGMSPVAGLIADGSGNLYGTTRIGGGSKCNPPFGCGTVFKLTPSGTETVLYSFTGGKDGAFPLAGLIADGSGNLYGTTSEGGGSKACENGCGVVFKLTGTGFRQAPGPSFSGNPRM